MKKRSWAIIHRKRRYGIEPEDYDKLLNEQKNACAICNTSDWKGNGPHIDHDHKTGKTRGLLCHSCNTALGSFKDNIEILMSAIDYIKKHK